MVVPRPRCVSSLRRWRLHRLLSWSGSLANLILEPRPDDRRIEADLLALDDARLHQPDHRHREDLDDLVRSQPHRELENVLLCGTLYVITPSTTFLRLRVTSQSGLVFRKRMRSRTLPMLWRYMSSIVANIAWEDSPSDRSCSLCLGRLSHRRTRGRCARRIASKRTNLP